MRLTFPAISAPREPRDVTLYRNGGGIVVEIRSHPEGDVVEAIVIEGYDAHICGIVMAQLARDVR